MQVTSKHLIVANSIKQQAINEHWQKDYRIPTQRELARKLGTSLQTINLAIKYLEGSGLVKSVKGSGCYWAENSALPKIALMDLTKFSAPKILFNVNDTQINVNEGPLFLAHYIKDWIIERGSSNEINSSNYLLTHNASSALFLALNLVKKTGGEILCEPLVDRALLSTAKALNIKLVSCEYDAEGLLVDDISKQISENNIKAIYLTPSGSNPLCNVASVSRRNQWVEIAKKHRLLIIENHLLGPLNSDEAPTLHQLMPDQTLQIQSISHQLTESIDLGILVGNETLIRLASTDLQLFGSYAGKSASYFLYRLLFEERHKKLFEENKARLRARTEIVKKYLNSPHKVHILPTHIWFEWPTSEQALLSLQYKNIRLEGEKAFDINNSSDIPTGFQLVTMNNRTEEEFKNAIIEIHNTLLSTANKNRTII